MRSVARALGGPLLLRGQALVHAIDAAVELIQPLTITLRLLRSGLRLGQGGIGEREIAP